MIKMSRACLTFQIMISLAQVAARAEPPGANSLWSFKPAASLEHYGIYQTGPFFSGDSRRWMESSLRLGGTLAYDGLTLKAQGIGLKTTGSDPYGSGNRPAGSPPETPGKGLDAVWDVDALYIQWEEEAAWPWKISLGRQPLAVGTQFMAGEGVYDGYHKDFPQAVYATPRQWFDAARLQLELGGTRVDAFAYRVHPTQEPDGHQDGYVAGVDVAREFEPIQGTYGGGLFRRESESNADNDMWVLSGRFKQHLPRWRDFYLSGEHVRELGEGRNPFYVTTPGQSLDEYAWHGEFGYEPAGARFRPSLELGYVYYSRDFTPLATGFSDWDSWYLGNQIVWIIFGTDTRIMRVKAGLWPHETVRLLAFYHHTEMATGPSGTLSDEWTLIADWYPNDRWWVSLLIGYSTPGRALRNAGLENYFTALNEGASSVGTSDSIDVVLGFGWSY